ncbi:DUF4199 domain-containing protein [uncultured Polaribacter sp.]|uniref:DUF4199 domain-containing protein n=1 Tax=uncultured Polaribacter sp. TaxID=174711 RepID=UPI00263485B0|nr:DUF4199 domain-containing protein [uncultured Polaribacter sp.]
MENEVNSKSIIVNNGATLGVIGIIISVVIYAMGMHLDPHWSVSVVQSAVVIAFVILGIKKFKAANGGFMSWGQGVKIGVGITVLAGLIGAIYNYVFISFIEPDFLTQMMEVQNQKFLDQGLTEEQIETANAMSGSMQNPLIISAFAIIGSAIFGFVIAAIAAAIMKKSEEETY